MTLFTFIYKSLRKVYNIISQKLENIITIIVLLGNGVKYGNNLISNGIPNIDVWNRGRFEIGDNFKMNNGSNYNKIGRQQSCFFIVKTKATLAIGNDVGVSSTAIVCHNNIIIGNYVKIGGNTVIYDTDFHSLNYISRQHSELDMEETKSAPVIIHDNVFIGAHCTILKGVTIGENSIIGAASVITKSVPANEIWAGNPARFIKNINSYQ